MGMHLFTAATLDRLVGMLGGYLREATGNVGADLFEAWPVITPNVSVQEWLRLDLIQRFQGGLEPAFSNLGDGLWGLWKRHAGPFDPEPRLLSDGHLRDLVLAALLSVTEKADGRLAPVRSYLEAGGGADRDRRAWQFAAQITGLFLRYETEAGLPDGVDPSAFPLIDETVARLNGSPEHLAWQKILYHNIFQNNGLRSTVFPDRFTLRQLAAGHPLARPAGSTGVRPVVVFGFDSLPPLALDILRRLGDILPVALFLLDTGSPAAVTHPLDRWRAPFLSLRRSLGNIASSAAPSEPPSPAPRSLLDTLRAKLRSSPGIDPVKRTQDASLQLWACPGPQREVETVARLLAGQTDATAADTTETAVLVTRPDEYLPLFREAFQRLRIPFSAAGDGSDLPGPYADGVEALFDLAKNGFTRAGVFRILSNPCWQHKRWVQPGMVRDWLTWADELGIFAGFSTEDKCRSCDLPGREPCDACRNPEAREQGNGMTGAHTFESALRRLRLGRLMECRNFSPSDTEMPAWRGYVPFQDFATSDADTLGAFSVGVEMLHLMTRRLKDTCGAPPSPAWAETLRGILDACLAARPDQPDEIAARSHAFGMIDHFAELEPLVSNGLGLELVRSGLVGACAGAGGEGAGRLFMGGVTIAPLSAAATLPWRRVFIVGLEETRFPGSGLSSSLNLLEPLPGAAERAADGPVSGDETNRQAFLQALLACREKMVLTYSCIDPAKEAELNPSSVICELEAFLRDHVLANRETLRRVIVPSTPLSDRFLLPDAEPWHDTLRLVDRDEWLTSLLLADRNNSPRLPRGPATDRLIEEARANRGIQLPQAVETAPKELTLRVWTSQLSTFLQDPATAVLQRWIRTDTDDSADDWEEIRSAPLAADWRMGRNLIRNAANAFFQMEPRDRPDPPATFFRKAYDWEVLRSRLPDGLWGKIDRERLADQFDDLVESIRKHQGDRVRDERLETILLGRFSTSRHVRGIPPLRTRVSAPPAMTPTPTAQGVAAKEWTIELHGRLPLVWRDDAGLNALVIRNAKTSSAKLDGNLLTPLLTYLALLVRDEDAATAGARVVDGAPLCLHAISTDGSATFRFLPDAGFARSYLNELVREYLAQRSFDDLRLKIVNSINYPEENTPAEEYAATLAEKRDELLAGKYPPSYFTDLFETLDEPAIPEDALEKVKRRLAPLETRLARVEKKPAAEEEEA
ncbi:MAG TPA: exodeoxyribonuclease V subunit gamma [Candidatus Ozemobacteraceae bacterium]|nr:exodeoxyribonuclease V subunit gamma [Candidatus Ozemobacteraceae bacterium]